MGKVGCREGNFAEKKMERRDSENERMREGREREFRMELMERARGCWERGRTFREDRARCKRFTYGDQWSDMLTIRNETLTEEEHLLRQGRVPLKNNLIRRLVRNVLGVFRDRYKLPECRARDAAETSQAAVMRRLLVYNAEVNSLAELYARSMEEFLISGLVVHKKWFGPKGRLSDCWTDFVQPDAFFVDGWGRDFRGWDTSLIGEIHSVTPQELLATFARSHEDRERLVAAYGLVEPLDADARCQVTEVWVREHPERWHCHDRALGECYKIDDADYRARVVAENRRREPQGIPPVEASWFVDEEWRWYFLAPSGEVLASGASPYRHGGHPYVFKAYPFIDGEIHSFVSDIVDQQKVTNRLISMYDWILQASAKGVLLLPEGALPPEMSLDDIADEWSRFDGVIVFRPKPGDPLPQQISSKCADIGITELLNIQMKMMEDISGVNGALQGKLENGSMSGTLYNQQTRNSLTALSDLMLCYDDFIRQCTAMDADNIARFYGPGRIRAIAGAEARLERMEGFSATRFDFRF